MLENELHVFVSVLPVALDGYQVLSIWQHDSPLELFLIFINFLALTPVFDF